MKLLLVLLLIGAVLADKALLCDSNDLTGCLQKMYKSLKSSQDSPNSAEWKDWPGNRVPVTSNFVAGLIIGALEAAVIYGFFKYDTVLCGFSLARCNTGIRLKVGDKIRMGLQLLFLLAALFGWVYFSTIVVFFWNFISWLFIIIGFALVFPPVYLFYKKESADVKNKRMTVRLLISGILLGLLSLGLFPNVKRMYTSEVGRRSFWRDSRVVTPHAESIQSYMKEFLANHTNFNTLSFSQQMDAVDIFVFDTIKWHDDMKRWGMVGTILIPDEVLQFRAGDCQGQAVTTASLLIALGFEAWVVETPFHWWTHARDPSSGEEHNLNVHGSSRQFGSVLPQPIDMVFTAPPQGVNDHGLYYFAPPLRAMMIAITGTHEFVRDFEPKAKFTTYIVIILLMSLISAVYITLLGTVGTRHTILGNVARTCLAFVHCLLMYVPIIFLFWFWIVTFYPICLMHLVFNVVAVHMRLCSNMVKRPEIQLQRAGSSMTEMTTVSTDETSTPLHNVCVA